MEFDVAAYLTSKGFRGKSVSGGRELIYPCFFDCEEPAQSTKRKLYIQPSSGFYHCKVCESSGGSYMLQKHFGDEPRSGTTDDTFMRRRILDAAVEVGETMLGQNDDVMLYLLGERGLSEETIVKRRIGFVAGGWSLTGTLPQDATREQLLSTGLVHREGPKAGKDFFWRHVLIPYLSRGHCIQVRGRIWGESSGGKYMTGPGEPVRLYNSDSLDGAEEVIVCEGEFDAMILAQALAASGDQRARRMAVVGLAGTGAIPEEFTDVLSEVKRIYLGLDSDEPGARAAASLKDRLGPRARILELPNYDGRKCDWTEYLLPASGPHDWPNRHPYAGHTADDVLHLLATAAGKRIFTVAEAGRAFRSYRAINSGLQLGFRELDATFKPGLLPGQIVVVLAKTGTGKTLFLCNLVYNMRDQRILFVSLEMTREEVYERLRRIWLFHHPLATDPEIEHGLRNVLICDENRLGEKDLSALVSEFAVEADGSPEVMMVDYLGYYARGQKGQSPYEKMSNAVMQLKAEAKAHRMVIISPAQVNRGAKEGKPIDLDDARDAGQIEETADFLLALYRPDDALDPDGPQPMSGKLKISVLKSRHGGKGNNFALQGDLLTLAMVDDNTKAARTAEEHNRMAGRGLDWEDLRRQQLAPIQREMRYGK